MKIAIPYENGQVFQHFGHSAQFKLYTAEEGRITGAEVVSTDGQGHGALVGFLVRNGVNVLLCGGIGARLRHSAGACRAADTGRINAGVLRISGRLFCYFSEASDAYSSSSSGKDGSLVSSARSSSFARSSSGKGTNSSV